MSSIPASFTKAEFEAALPAHASTKHPLWICLGLDKGEFIYSIPVQGAAAAVFIRSSIGSNLQSKPKGEDSIRLWLGDPATRKPLAAKLSKYITRTQGWDSRLVEQVRTLWRLAKELGTCDCGKLRVLRVVEKDGPNKGRAFTCCPANCRESFKFIEL